MKDNNSVAMRKCSVLECVECLGCTCRRCVTWVASRLSRCTWMAKSVVSGGITPLYRLAWVQLGRDKGQFQEWSHWSPDLCLSLLPRCIFSFPRLPCSFFPHSCIMHNTFLLHSPYSRKRSRVSLGGDMGSEMEVILHIPYSNFAFPLLLSNKEVTYTFFLFAN